jgi:hypothetical protein
MAQQIYTVLPGQPFGRGTSTDTISSDSFERSYCSGSAGSAVLTVGSSNFNNGDLLFITQSKGTGAGAWEIAKVLTGGGGTTLTLDRNLANTYTRSTGSADANCPQVIRIKESLNMTLNTFTGTPWSATENYNANAFGGIIPIAVSNKLTIGGTPNLNGKNGWATSQDHNTASTTDYYVHGSVTGGGFRGGWNSTDGSSGGAGESYDGSFVQETKNAVYGGGGGAVAIDDPAAGAGHANTGGNSGAPTAYGGASYGTASLSSIFFGSGGGGGNNGVSAGSGGGGGGVWMIWAREIEITGGLQANAGNGGAGNGEGDGGGGSGGSVLINCERGNIGTNKITVAGGSAGGATAGAGSVGRIRINYGATLTGSSSPSASTAQNDNLIINEGASFFFGVI